MRAAIRMRRSSRDLVQESHVRIVENPYVGDVVAKHRYPRRPHAERPAGVAVAIESGRSHYGRMHHSGAEYLHPAGALAASASGAVTELTLHVHLGGRLREWEVARPEPGLRFSEESIGEVRQRSLEIYEAHAFIERETFDLREHR